MSTSVPNPLIVRSRRLPVKAIIPSPNVLAPSYLAPGSVNTDRRRH